MSEHQLGNASQHESSEHKGEVEILVTQQKTDATRSARETPRAWGATQDPGTAALHPLRS
ncbi:hypothetical protein RSAG8_03008, partial [Rhizoctonia solani AG-8 WAC10335]